jgi:hypothetical protein
MATTTAKTLTTTYTAINTVDTEYIIQAKGNKRIFIKYAAVDPSADTSYDNTIELEPGQGISSDQIVGIAYGKVIEGTGTVTVTE